MKSKENDQLSSTALLLQRIIRKGHMPPKYNFLDYVHAIRKLKTASNGQLKNGKCDDLVEHCIAYALYNNNRTALQKLAFVLFSGDRSFSRIYMRRHYHIFLGYLIYRPESQIDDIARVLKDTFVDWKKYCRQQSDNKYHWTWVDLRDRLIKLLPVKKSDTKLFSALEVFKILDYCKDIFREDWEAPLVTSQLLDTVNQVFAITDCSQDFMAKEEYENLKARCLQSIQQIDDFVKSNVDVEIKYIDKSSEEKRLSLVQKLEPFYQLCRFLSAHRDAFNYGFKWHSEEKHWNHQGNFENATPDTTIRVSFGSGLFYSTSFIAGQDRGYVCDRESNRRGIYVALDPKVTVPALYSDSYYAHRECVWHFDIPWLIYQAESILVQPSHAN